MTTFLWVVAGVAGVLAILAIFIACFAYIDYHARVNAPISGDDD